MKPLPDEIRCYLAFADFRSFAEGNEGEEVWLHYMHCRMLDRQVAHELQGWIHYDTTYQFTDAAVIPVGVSNAWMEDLLLTLCRKVGNYTFDEDFEQWA